MTQTTETTAERVQRIVYPWAGLSFGAEEIAAEIDALTRECDEARAQRKLDVMTIAAQADVIDERNAQLAEARAEIEAWRDERTRMRHAMAAAGILNQFFADEAAERARAAKERKP